MPQPSGDASRPRAVEVRAAETVNHRGRRCRPSLSEISNAVLLIRRHGRVEYAVIHQGSSSGGAGRGGERHTRDILSSRRLR